LPISGWHLVADEERQELGFAFRSRPANRRATGQNEIATKEIAANSVKRSFTYEEPPEKESRFPIEIRTDFFHVMTPKNSLCGDSHQMFCRIFL
jgi:hypothetical protein